MAVSSPAHDRAVQAIVGPQRARIAALLDAGISLYAAHLPLDAHSGVGNNAVLARLLKLENLTPFGRWGPRQIGWRGSLEAPTDRAALAAGLEALLGARPDILPFGKDEIRSVAIVSGAAADLVSEAAESGVDAFVTGETSHVAWHHARELGMNVFFAGHRLRVHITSSSVPRWERNLNTADPQDSYGEVARQRIHHDAYHPSYVDLPVVA